MGRRCDLRCNPAVAGVARMERVSRSCASMAQREGQPMDETPILVEGRAGYRVITLNRPQRLNAFTETMHQALKRALVEAENDTDCRALLLTGAGRGFCAGQDLNERVAAEWQDDGAREHARDLLQSAGAHAARAALPGRRRRQAPPPAPAPISRSPATSCWRRARRASSRPSPRSDWCRIAAAPGSAAAGRSGPRARACAHRPSRCRRKRLRPGASSGGRWTTELMAEAHKLCLAFASGPRSGSP